MRRIVLVSSILLVIGAIIYSGYSVVVYFRFSSDFEDIILVTQTEKGDSLDRILKKVAKELPEVKLKKYDKLDKYTITELRDIFLQNKAGSLIMFLIKNAWIYLLVCFSPFILMAVFELSYKVSSSFDEDIRVKLNESIIKNQSK